MALSPADLLAAVDAARTPGTTRVRVGRRTVTVSRPFPSPADWRDKWIYFVLVDRFNNPAAPPRKLPWDAECDTFQGGTLAGVQAKLDYLQQLGVGALALSPVLKNRPYDDAYHGYAVEDLFAVEPRLTSDPDRARQDPAFAAAELRALVDAAHARGIHVLLDIVLDPPADAVEHDGPALSRRSALIRAYQYVVAAFDVDGFRIDTLTSVEPDVALAFANAIREYALSIGKANFFTVAGFRDHEDAALPGSAVGVDAALDFPLTYLLPGVAKGFVPPSALVDMYQHRKQAQAAVLSSHGEASRSFVTFLDDHDGPSRFGYTGDGDTGDEADRFGNQVTLALACLFTLQGVPCLYYGTEQDLRGSGSGPESVREALWGKPGAGKVGAFEPAAPVATVIRTLTDLRAAEPALRYGRQYFRPVSGDGVRFSISGFPAGILAFSRVLSDREVVVVANTNTEVAWTGEVLVDRTLMPVDGPVEVLFGNLEDAVAPTLADKRAGSVEIHEVGGGTTTGPARALRVGLRPMEVLVLAPRRP